jgi:MoxR-like ATPase
MDTVRPATEDMERCRRIIQDVSVAVSRVIIGQKGLIERLLIVLTANQHALLEGVPGLAKTLAVSSLARTLGVDYHRIQFTPDLLPADLLGTLIYNPGSGGFTTRKGPLFASLILADEINRAPAKVQSALLEAMQEKQITLGETTYPLPQPFMVLATQNPLDQEGTYPLPEAQVDRFMMKIKIDYPDRSEETAILRQRGRIALADDVPVTANADDILFLRSCADKIYTEPRLEDFMVDLVRKTREPSPYITCGASPRASLALAVASRCRALIEGRDYVLPEDIHTIVCDVLRHRIILSYEAEADNRDTDSLIREIIKNTPLP